MTYKLSQLPYFAKGGKKITSFSGCRVSFGGDGTTHAHWIQREEYGKGILCELNKKTHFWMVDCAIENKKN